MASKIKAVALRINEQEKHRGQIVYINVLGSNTEGTFWRTPVTDNHGAFLRFDYLKKAAKPTVDSAKVLRVKNSEDQNVYWVLIADTDNGDSFNNRANTSGDSVTPMPAVAIPDMLLESLGGYVDGVSLSYFSIVDALGSGESYQLKASKNGAYLTPDLSGNAYADVASAVAAANTNWGNSGQNVFTNPTTYKILMVSNGANTGSVSLVKVLTFQSATIAVLSGGNNNYKLVVQADGINYDPVYATTVAALAAAASNDVSLALLGLFSSITSNTKIQLITSKATIVTLTITQVTL